MYNNINLYSSKSEKNDHECDTKTRVKINHKLKEELKFNAVVMYGLSTILFDLVLYKMINVIDVKGKSSNIITLVVEE